MMTKEEIMEKIRSKSIVGESDDDCYLFTGALNNGHGIINIDGKNYRVHKLVQCLENNFHIMDDTIQVNHKCKNRNCWNPKHTYIGTQLENVLDRQQSPHAVSGAWGNSLNNKFKTHCPHGHEYTIANTQLQKSRTGFYRKCRECARLSKNFNGGERKLPEGQYYSSKKR
jgi:hypothetical protein